MVAGRVVVVVDAGGAVVGGAVVVVVVVGLAVTGGGTKVNMPWAQSSGGWAITTSTPGMFENVHTGKGGPFWRHANAGEVVATVVTVPTNWADPVTAGGVTGVKGTVT